MSILNVHHIKEIQFRCKLENYIKFDGKIFEIVKDGVKIRGEGLYSFKTNRKYAKIILYYQIIEEKYNYLIKFTQKYNVARLNPNLILYRKK